MDIVSHDVHQEELSESDEILLPLTDTPQTCQSETPVMNANQKFQDFLDVFKELYYRHEASAFEPIC